MDSQQVWERQMTELPVRLGIDVGGTNTDAVLMLGRELLASHKSFTTADVRAGVVTCVEELLRQGAISPKRIGAVMIGTTQFVNAFVQRRDLQRVGVIRVGAPKTDGVPPLAGWPADLRQDLAEAHLVQGGAFFNGEEHAPLDEAAVRSAASTAWGNGIRSFAVSATFGPVRPELERRVAAVIRDVAPDAAITLSTDVGGLGLIDRENAAIINSSLAQLSARVVTSLAQAFSAMDIHVPILFSQNDGTLITSELASRFPILTCSAGPTNSLRGAAFLTGLKEAVIADIGGTTTDIGFLMKGFPRETTTPNYLGGVRTNLRMPDLLSLALGGGTIIRHRAGKVSLGPDSVGYRLKDEGLVFGGAVTTATDIAVAAGSAKLGDAALVASLDRGLVSAASEAIHSAIEDGIDQMRTSGLLAPLVLVGGGHVLVSRPLAGVSETVRPKHAEVANAIGAAIAMVSGRVNRMFDFKTKGRAAALAEARAEAVAAAVAAGAIPDSVEVVEQIELPMPYIDTGSVQVKVRAVGEMAIAAGRAM
jgi:N-methylhydantoinase A/oxoprolinase/acetone carboxylase beta subunit